MKTLTIFLLLMCLVGTQASQASDVEAAAAARAQARNEYFKKVLANPALPAQERAKLRKQMLSPTDEAVTKARAQASQDRLNAESSPKARPNYPVKLMKSGTSANPAKPQAAVTSKGASAPEPRAQPEVQVEASGVPKVIEFAPKSAKNAKP